MFLRFLIQESGEKEDVKPIFSLAQIQEFFLSYLINHKSSVNFFKFLSVLKEERKKTEKANETFYRVEKLFL
jgi:hypothetical protein